MEQENQTYDEAQQAPEASTYETYLDELTNTDFIDRGLDQMMPPELDYDEKIKQMME